MPSLTLPALPAASTSNASRSTPAHALNVALIAPGESVSASRPAISNATPAFAFILLIHICLCTPDKYAKQVLSGEHEHSCMSLHQFSEPEAVLHAVEHLYFKADKLLLRRAPTDTALQPHWRSLVLHTLAGFEPVSAVFVVVDDEPSDAAAQADAWMQLSAMSDVISIIPVLPESLQSAPAHLDMSPSCLSAADLCMHTKDNAGDPYLRLDQVKSLLHQEADPDAVHALQSRAIANFTHWRHLAAPSLYKPASGGARRASSSSSPAARSQASSSASSVRSTSSTSLRRSRQRSRRASTRPSRSVLNDSPCGPAAAAAADSTWVFSAHDPISFSLIAQMGRLLYSVVGHRSFAAEDVAKNSIESAADGASSGDKHGSPDLPYVTVSDFGLLVYGGALAAAAAAAVGMVAWLGRGTISCFAH